MRQVGWEERLSQIVTQAAREPYVLGVHDCFKFACDVVASITGNPSRWSEFSGQYSTREQAVSLLKEHGETFEDAFDWLWGFQRIDWKRAMRGDVVSFRTEDGWKHLGVCVGASFVGLSAAGLVLVPMRQSSVAWRVE